MNIRATVGDATMYAEQTVFSSGREGFRAQGKLMNGGKRYQVQILITEIWDKDDPRRAGGAPAAAPVRKAPKAAAPAAVQNGPAAKAF